MRSLLLAAALGLGTLAAPALAQEPAPATTTEQVENLRPEEQGRPLHVVRAGEVRRAVTEWLAPISVSLGAILGGFALLACQLLALALFPVAAARARTVATRRTWLPAALGAVNVVGYGVVIAVAVQLGPLGALVGALATVGCFGAMILGLSGRAQAIGARLLGPERRDSALAATSLGWAVMAGAGLVPFVGWTLMGWWLVQSLGTSALVVIGALGSAAAADRSPHAAR